MVWALFAVTTQILQPDTMDAGEGLAMIRIFGLIGLVSGTAFAVLLASVESGRIAGDISLGRAAMWGIAGTAIVPLLAGKYDQVFPLCPVGMAIGAALVSIARKGAQCASRNRPGLPDALLAWLFISLQEATTPPNTRPWA
jgi:hypothetical protein